MHCSGGSLTLTLMSTRSTRYWGELADDEDLGVHPPRVLVRSRHSDRPGICWGRSPQSVAKFSKLTKDDSQLGFLRRRVGRLEGGT